MQGDEAEPPAAESHRAKTVEAAVMRGTESAVMRTATERAVTSGGGERARPQTTTTSAMAVVAESAPGAQTPRLLARSADMTRQQWRNYKKVSKQLARST